MVNLWFESALLPGGWARKVRVTTAADGSIAQIETGVAPSESGERHAIGVAGLPNVHSHAFQRGLAGLTERRGPTGDSFWTWRELMYRFVERIDPEQFEAIAALAYADMLEGGFTHVGEFHYLHHDRGGAAFANPGELAGRIAAAAEQSGIGLTLLPTFYAHSGFGGAEPSARQQRFINNPERFARIVEASRKAVQTLAGGSVGVAPHSLRAVTPEELTAVVELAQGGVIHIHIAEQMKEVEDCVAWSGRRPIELLLETQAVDGRWCLVHATHTTDAELRDMAKSGAVVGLCPITEANLGDGIFPAGAFLAQKGRYGIGSDSNVLLDAAEELRTLEYSQRLAQRARNVLASAQSLSTGRSLYEDALAGGTQALHSSVGAPRAASTSPMAPATSAFATARTKSAAARAAGASAAATSSANLPSTAGAPPAAGLAVGASADIVTLSATHPSLIERRDDELLDSWIFAAGRAAVDCVWRAGVKVVINGRHQRRDAIVARYASALKSLLA